MLKLKRVVCLLAPLVLAACVSTKNVPLEVASSGIEDATSVTTSKRQKPDFVATTAGKATFGGLIGAGLMVSAGNKIVNENKVEDPADYIASVLSQHLQTRFGLSPRDNGAKLIDSNSPGDLSQTYSGSDLVVDVETVNWSFVYFPTDWNNYRVIYAAKLRLVDTKNKSTVAEGFCSRNPDKDENSPSHDELLANQAQRLKDELRTAADYCIGEFKQNVLRI